MYTTRDVYGNPRFIIHFLDLVHEDHPGDHCDKMESARRMSNKHGGRRYRGRVFGGGFVFQVYAATEHFVTCKGASWVPYAVAVAKRANAKVEVFKEPTGGFCYKFQPDLGSWTCVDSHRITFMRHNKIEKRFERIRVKDVDDKYTRYINRDRTKSGEYLPLKLNRINMIRSESWEHSEIEEAAVEAFLKDNGDSYIMEEMILAANYLMP